MVEIIRRPSTQELYTILSVDGYYANPISKGIYPGGTPTKILSTPKGCLNKTLLENINRTLDKYFTTDEDNIHVCSIEPNHQDHYCRSDFLPLKAEFDSDSLINGRLVHLLFLGKGSINKMLNYSRKAYKENDITLKNKADYNNYRFFKRDVKNFLNIVNNIFNHPYNVFQYILNNKGILLTK